MALNHICRGAVTPLTILTQTLFTRECLLDKNYFTDIFMLLAVAIIYQHMQTLILTQITVQTSKRSFTSKQ